jgi:hypothetical protein
LTEALATTEPRVIVFEVGGVIHSKGEHSKGSLIHDNATEILIYGSLYASNVDRSPLFKGGSRGAVVNNFIMNPNQYVITYGLVASEWGEQPYQTGMISMVGNVFHRGLDTLAAGAFLQGNVAQDLGGNPVDWLAEALSVLPSGEVLQNVLDEVGARSWDRDVSSSRRSRSTL